MRRQLITVALAAIFVRTAQALQAPTDLQLMQTIQAELAQVQKLQADIKKKRELQDKQRASIDPDKGMIAGYEKDIQSLKQQQAQTCRQLIKDDIQAYGLRPPRLSGVRQSGSLKGDQVRWEPKFGDWDAYKSLKRVEPNEKTGTDEIVIKREFTGSSGASGISKVSGGPNGDSWPDGVTWPDGQMEVFLPVFLQSPGFLAAAASARR